MQALHGNNPERRECFAVEYSNILLKDVLVYREYRNALGGSSMYSGELVLVALVPALCVCITNACTCVSM